MPRSTPFRITVNPPAAQQIGRCSITSQILRDDKASEAEAFYFDLDFVGIWWRNIQILDFQNACITIFVEANDACHDFSSNLKTN
jgi:hypothetical protein